MPGKRDGIGIFVEQICDRAVVSAPSPRAVAGIFGMRMLNVEEGLPVGLQFGVVLLKEVGQSRDMVLVLPMRADEVVTLDCLHPDGLVRLLETLFPGLFALRSDALRFSRRSPDVLDGSAPTVGLHVVVAVDEELLRLFPLQTFVLRKDLEPSVCHDLQFGKQSLVGHVAGYDNAVHLQTTEVFEGVDERLGSVCAAKMNVAHDADDQVGLAQRSQRLSPARSAQVSCSGQGTRSPEEFSSVHNQQLSAYKDTKKLTIKRHDVENNLT